MHHFDFCRTDIKRKISKGVFMNNEKQKTMLRIVGIIALTAVIGFVFAACGGGQKLTFTKK